MMMQASLLHGVAGRVFGGLARSNILQHVFRRSGDEEVCDEFYNLF